MSGVEEAMEMQFLIGELVAYSQSIRELTIDIGETAKADTEALVVKLGERGRLIRRLQCLERGIQSLIEEKDVVFSDELKEAARGTCLLVGLIVALNGANEEAIMKEMAQ